jgi:hypothetical protein
MYLVIDRKTLKVWRVSSIEKANFVADPDGLGEEAIAWAIEEYGRCDGNDYTIIPEEWENPDDKA